MRHNIAVLILVAVSTHAQELMIVEDRGHISPVRATITFRNDKTRQVVIRGTGLRDSSLTHVFIVRTEDGVSKRTLWIDSIASITGLDSLRRARDEFKVEMKDGTAFPAMFTGELPAGCEAANLFENPKDACATLFIGNGDDSTEAVDMRYAPALIETTVVP